MLEQKIDVLSLRLQEKETKYQELKVAYELMRNTLFKSATLDEVTLVDNLNEQLSEATQNLEILSKDKDEAKIEIASLRENLGK